MYTLLSYGKCTVAAVHHYLLVATSREMHGEICTGISCLPTAGMKQFCLKILAFEGLHTDINV